MTMLLNFFHGDRLKVDLTRGKITPLIITGTFLWWINPDEFMFRAVGLRDMVVHTMEVLECNGVQYVVRRKTEEC